MLGTMRPRRITAFVLVSSFVAGCAFWDMGAWSGADVPLEAGSVDTGALVDAPSDGGSDALVDARVSYSDTVMADKPLAYWPLDDVDASSPVDVSGHNTQTTLVGNVYLVRDEDARGGGSANFAKGQGQGGRIDVEDSTPFYFFGKKSYSLEAWVKPNLNDPFTGGIAIHAATDPAFNLRGYGLRFNSLTSEAVSERNTLGGKLTVSCTLPATSPSDPPYVHLVATYDASTSNMLIYLNGTPYGPVVDPKGIGELPTTFSWGGWAAGASDAAVIYTPLWYYGNLDELAIYDTALLPDRIMAHYNAGKP